MKRLSRLVFLMGATALVLSPLTVNADDSPDWNQWSASAMAQYVVPGDDRFDVEDGAGFRFGLGHPLSENLSAELAAQGNTLVRDERSGRDWQYALGADALYRFHDGFITPYAIAGAGALFNDYAGGNDTGPYANLGLGLEMPVWRDRLSLRAEARYFADWTDDSAGDSRYDDARFYVGVSIPLFGKPEPETRIDVVEQVVERERVVKEIPDLQELEGVTFEFDSADLTPNAEAVLRQVARDLGRHSDVTVEIRGHTDSIGGPDYNQKLSEERAESVREFLVSQGIDETRITTRGFGYSEPVASNDTEEGRRLNRRIEMKRTDEDRSGPEEQ